MNTCIGKHCSLNTFLMDYIYGAYFLFRIVATPSKPTTPLPDTSSPIIKSGKGTSKATGVPTLLDNIVSPIKNIVSQVTSERPATQEDSCKATIQVRWPSKVRKKVLDSDLSSLGKMLCRGTYRQIARAASSCKKLQQYFLEQVARQIHHECSEICGGELKKRLKFERPAFCGKLTMRALKTFHLSNLMKNWLNELHFFNLCSKPHHFALKTNVEDRCSVLVWQQQFAIRIAREIWLHFN